MIVKSLGIAAIVAAGIAGVAEARDQIRIVGSSTVFPFATKVAETFGRTSGFKTPVIKSTGSGGGMKLFCAGVGVDTPDVTNASRKIKDKEKKLCAKNGVTDITEVVIGYDGIAFANSKNGPKIDISKAEIFLALAAEVPEGGKKGGKMIANPYKNWNEINPALPASKIEVLGPPPTSGTRDAFVELVMQKGGRAFMDKKAASAAGKKIREDGAYIDAGENDNLIVQKLDANPAAFGIFGFSFLEENSDKIQGATVEGVEPTFENIASGKYGVSRSLQFYVKNQHIGAVPGISEFVREFTAESTWGPDGYLVEIGLIPLPDADRKAAARAAQEHAKLPL